MSDENVFGPIIDGFMVATAIKDTVSVWMPDYLAEVGAAHGIARGDLPTFKSYVLSTSDDRFDEDQIPSCMIVVPGAPTVDRNRGGYTLGWDCRIGAMTKGRNRDESLRNAMLTTAALRAILAQKGGLGGDPRLPGYRPFASRTVLTGEAYDVLDFEDNGRKRMLGAGAVLATVYVEGVVDSGSGPKEPSGDPTIDPGPWTTIETVNVTVEEM